jgi:hypothetical protein
VSRPGLTRITRRGQYRNRRRENRKLTDKFKDNPCADCGGRFPPECMDFDHRPGVVKVNVVSDIVKHSWGKVLREINKCDLVCANCHRIRTTRRSRETPQEQPSQQQDLFASLAEEVES